MRKMLAGLFMTLDGVVEEPENWSGPYWSDEMAEGISQGVSGADAILIGTRTYATFAKMWPEQGEDNPMAAFLNDTHKYVVSSTLDELEWGPASLLRGDDLVAQIRALKESSGGNIQVPGSPRLVRWLLAEGLLDELSLNVVPLVFGQGIRLFDDVDKAIPLKLVRSDALDTGVLGLTYQRAE